MAKIVRDAEYKDLIQARRFRSVQEIIVTTIRCYKEVGKVEVDAVEMYDLVKKLSSEDHTTGEICDKIQEFLKERTKEYGR